MPHHLKTTVLLILGVMLVLPILNSCFTPGPLKAERDADELFAPSEAAIVVDAILIVDAPLPPVDLRRTAAPGEAYDVQSLGLTGALVSITQGDAVVDYVADPAVAGRYWPPEPTPVVAPSTTYVLSVVSAADPEVRATTTTPPRMRIDELVLFELDADQEEVELGRLQLFSDVGEQVYEIPANQLEHTVGFLDVRIQMEGEGAASYQFGIDNLEKASPLLYSSELLDDEDLEDLERHETSRLLRLEDDRLVLTWEGINYAGRHKVKVFAVDENWFDLVRTDNVNADRSSGEAGQSFQRPLFHVENGIGLFASAVVDSFGFFVRPEGMPPCSGCECWGCGDRNAWSGILDLESGKGRLRYDRDVGTGATCELSYEISAASQVEPCADCLFARAFELGKLTVYRDRGACDDARDLRGESFRLAHGTQVISTEGGTPRHGLHFYVASEGIWWPLETGWSLVLPTATETRWLFGFSDE